MQNIDLDTLAEKLANIHDDEKVDFLQKYLNEFYEQNKADEILNFIINSVLINDSINFTKIYELIVRSSDNHDSLIASWNQTQLFRIIDNLNQAKNFIHTLIDIYVDTKRDEGFSVNLNI